MADTFEVGKKLVELCRANRNLEAVDTLYAGDVTSVETVSMPDLPARIEGVEAVRRKNQWWLDNHTIHGNQVSGPFPHGDRFIVHFRYDVTSKVGPMAGQRMQMEEAGLYTVRDGKVVKEEFFYHMG